MQNKRDKIRLRIWNYGILFVFYYMKGWQSDFINYLFLIDKFIIRNNYKILNKIHPRPWCTWNAYSERRFYYKTFFILFELITNKINIITIHTFICFTYFIIVIVRLWFCFGWQHIFLIFNSHFRLKYFSEYLKFLYTRIEF